MSVEYKEAFWYCSHADSQLRPASRADTKGPRFLQNLTWVSNTDTHARALAHTARPHEGDLTDMVKSMDFYASPTCTLTLGWPQERAQQGQFKLKVTV